MYQRLIGIFLLAILAFFVARVFGVEAFSTWVEVPAIAAPTTKPPIYGEHDIAQGGPNPPAAAAPETMPRIVNPQPSERDPYDDRFEHADAPEQMRYPERSFGPGVVPEQTEFAESAGIAGPVAESSQSFQQFSPEFVSNGGNFFGDVSANEDENPNYSAF